MLIPRLLLSENEKASYARMRGGFKIAEASFCIKAQSKFKVLSMKHAHNLDAHNAQGTNVNHEPLEFVALRYCRTQKKMSPASLGLRSSICIGGNRENQIWFGQHNPPSQYWTETDENDGSREGFETARCTKGKANRMQGAQNARCFENKMCKMPIIGKQSAKSCGWFRSEFSISRRNEKLRPETQWSHAVRFQID